MIVILLIIMLYLFLYEDNSDLVDGWTLRCRWTRTGSAVVGGLIWTLMPNITSKPFAFLVLSQS